MKTKEQKHTPGPWETEDRNNDLRVIWSSRKTQVARTDTSIHHSRQEQEANARLIAAAPDLIEALKAVQKRYADISGFTIDGENKKTLDIVDAAIEKAEAGK